MKKNSTGQKPKPENSAEEWPDVIGGGGLDGSL